MKTKRQKHWTTEEQILKAIDKAHKEQRMLCFKAEGLERQADQLAEQACNEKDFTQNERNGFMEASDEARREADYVFKQAARKDVRLEKLKNTLAAFRTALLPGITGDRSVVTQELNHN